MSLDREALLGAAHAERQRLGRTIQYAELDTWDKPSACHGWWNRDVMAHLAAGDTAAAQLVAGLPAAEVEEYHALPGTQPFSLDAFNDWCVNRRSGLETRQILTTWGAAAESLLAHAARLTDAEWADARYPWFLGDIAARYLVQSRVVEWWLHGEDIRATNGLGPSWEHWPIYLTNDMGIRMLPWALQQAGLDFSGYTVEIELEGPGGGSWRWGLGPGEIPHGGTPDAAIRGRAPQFALVAGRRLPADDVLDSGHVTLGRRTDIAEAVLRNIRAFA